MPVKPLSVGFRLFARKFLLGALPQPGHGLQTLPSEGFAQFLRNSNAILLLPSAGGLCYQQPSVS
jgi:hypothetical protein